jgi:indole-3-glycerol phosphate synthase
MFLETIIAHKLQEIAARKQERTMREVRAAAESAVPPLDFTGAIRQPAGAARARPRLIAEVK